MAFKSITLDQLVLGSSWGHWAILVTSLVIHKGRKISILLLHLC